MQKKSKKKLPCHFDDLLGGEIPQAQPCLFEGGTTEKSPRKKMVLFMGDFSLRSK